MGWNGEWILKIWSIKISIKYPRISSRTSSPIDYWQLLLNHYYRPISDKRRKSKSIRISGLVFFSFRIVDERKSPGNLLRQWLFQMLRNAAATFSHDSPYQLLWPRTEGVFIRRKIIVISVVERAWDFILSSWFKRRLH